LEPGGGRRRGGAPTTTTQAKKQSIALCDRERRKLASQ
jgi:hypothetical protein